PAAASTTSSTTALGRRSVSTWPASPTTAASRTRRCPVACGTTSWPSWPPASSTGAGCGPTTGDQPPRRDGGLSAMVVDNHALAGPGSDGKTPLPAELQADLLPTWVATIGELYEVEELGIAAATLGLAPALDELLDDVWLKRLHAR